MIDRTRLDPARRKLLELIDATPGADLKNLSRRLGRNDAYLQQYVDRGSPRQLDEDDRDLLAGVLGCTSAELKVDGLYKKPIDRMNPPLRGGAGGLTMQPGSARAFAGQRDVPILGHVKAGVEGFFIDNGDIRGYAVRPEYLRGNQDAYAVYVHDDSMVPACEPGWTLLVDPGRPATKGQNVVIQLIDGQAFIKRLVRQTEKHIICKQWNPEHEIKFDRAKVKSVHAVVTILTVPA